MLGVYQGGRKVVDNDSIEWRAETSRKARSAHEAQHDTLDRITEYSLIVYLGLIGSRCWRAARAPCTSGAAA